MSDINAYLKNIAPLFVPLVRMKLIGANSCRQGILGLKYFVGQNLRFFTFLQYSNQKTPVSYTKLLPLYHKIKDKLLIDNPDDILFERELSLLSHAPSRESLTGEQVGGERDGGKRVGDELLERLYMHVTCTDSKYCIQIRDTQTAGTQIGRSTKTEGIQTGGTQTGSTQPRPLHSVSKHRVMHI